MENLNDLQKFMDSMNNDDNPFYEKSELSSPPAKLTVFENSKKEVKDNTSLLNTTEEYIALGYKGQTNYIYSVKRQIIIELNSSDFTKSNLLNLFNNDYLINNFPIYNDKGNIVGFSTAQFQSKIVNECVEKGIFEDENVKGWGIHKDTKNNALIINTRNIWGTSSSYNGSRVYNNQVFEIEKDLFINKDQKQVSKEEMLEYFEIIKSFNMSRGIQDSRLVLGWIGHAFFPGVLGWITHASLTGAAGTGKSTLQTLIKETLGGFAEIVEGNSSEAGIRQLVGNNAGVVLVDESEADSDKLNAILTMFRAASSGMSRVKGTADQKGKTFKLKMAGLLSGIVPPKMNQADNSRFLKIELNRLTNARDVHLKLDQNQKNWETNYKNYLKDIGKKMCVTLINNYNSVLVINAVVRNELLKNGYNNRYADTFGMLIAFSYFLLNCIDSDKLNEEDIQKYVSEFNFDKEVSQTSLRDEDELFNQIMITELQSDVIKKQNILQHILNYHVGQNKAEVKNLLGRYGIKTEKEEEKVVIYIDCDDNKLKLLLSNTRFSGGDLKPVLMRMNEAEDLKKEVSIGNIRRSRKGLISIILDTDKYKQDVIVEELEIESNHMEINNLKNEVKEEVISNIREEVKRELINSFKEQMLNEIKSNMSEILKEQMRQEIINEVKDEIRQDFKNQIEELKSLLMKK